MGGGLIEGKRDEKDAEEAGEGHGGPRREGERERKERRKGKGEKEASDAHLTLLCAPKAREKIDPQTLMMLREIFIFGGKFFVFWR